MNIDDYIDLVVIVELDTGAKHEGVLEESNVFGYVKITNGAEVFICRGKRLLLSNRFME